MLQTDEIGVGGYADAVAAGVLCRVESAIFRARKRVAVACVLGIEAAVSRSATATIATAVKMISLTRDLRLAAWAFRSQQIFSAHG